MKPSFVNNQSHSVNDLSDYQLNIHKFRKLASKAWCENCANYGDQVSFNSKTPPAFFVDKYGFRSWITSTTPTILPEHTAIPEIYLTNLFESYDETVKKSVVGSNILGTKPPSVDKPVHRSHFLKKLFASWQKHLAQNGINLPDKTIDWYFSVPLLEVYRKSVFYPRYPVLWGPKYFSKISKVDQDYVVNNFGEGAVWDFYFFMMVCHEQSHLMQKGEPILNEIVHAILWIDFILDQGLEPFQINSKTGETCNIEAPFILNRVGNLKGLNYRLLFEDNFKYFEQETVGSHYGHFVALTFLVHAGFLRYRYLPICSVVYWLAILTSTSTWRRASPTISRLYFMA